MSPSSLESQILAHVGGQNLNAAPVEQGQSISNGRRVRDLTQIGRSIHGQINEAVADCRSNFMLTTAKTLGMLLAFTPEGVLLYGAHKCKNDPQGWNLPCGVNYSDDVGAYIYAGLSVVYPILVAMGLYYTTRR
ncbi:MAG: hypothetical protein HWD61_11445 [Parachlamydiaceae bacterium]|nr:MAG: hypothetical protein HWD61_11445 [Parachlamydiaceae bacterium]